jgi:hypothetical protein
MEVPIQDQVTPWTLGFWRGQHIMAGNTWQSRLLTSWSRKQRRKDTYTGIPQSPLRVHLQWTKGILQGPVSQILYHLPRQEHHPGTKPFPCGPLGAHGSKPWQPLKNFSPVGICLWRQAWYLVCWPWRVWRTSKSICPNRKCSS